MGLNIRAGVVLQRHRDRLLILGTMARKAITIQGIVHVLYAYLSRGAEQSIPYLQDPLNMIGMLF